MNTIKISVCAAALVSSVASNKSAALAIAVTARLSERSCASHTPRSCGLGAYYYLERTSHDPRAPPLS
ncbi:hypothetical protein [Hyphomicrobium sp.]|uniref:hypothetical protein n=1 Tax=Hyphomicrobium sp. TaxID=82 RepID=UPI001DF2D205|nr:hypothetical protein [Hyphomicrobium sp.]MBY0561968.1 hypothetical protein [Hyphomicrobium sp.]